MITKTTNYTSDLSIDVNPRHLIADHVRVYFTQNVHWLDDADCAAIQLIVRTLEIYNEQIYIHIYIYTYRELIIDSQTEQHLFYLKNSSRVFDSCVRRDDDAKHITRLRRSFASIERN